MANLTQYSLTSRHVDTVNPQTDQPNSKSRDHKMDMRVTRPSVPKETGGEEQTSGDGEVQSRLWDWLAGLFLILVAGIEIEAVLERVDDCSNDRSY